MRTRLVVLVLPFALALCAPLAALARPVVTVTDFKGPKADKARNAIVSALQKADKVDVVPFNRVKAAAPKAKVKAKDLAGRPGALKAAKAAGVDAAVFGDIEDGKLTLTVLSVGEKELWSKQVKLERGELTADLARRFASAVAAAVGVAGGDEEAVASEESPKASSGGRKAPPAPRAGKIIVVEGGGSEDSPAEEDDGLRDRRRRVERREGAEGEGEEPASEVDSEDVAEREPASGGKSWLDASGIVQVSLDYTATWRGYNFCPEVQDCDEQSPAGAGAAVKYSTDVPYGGFQLGVGFYPLRARTDLLRGLGVAAAYSHSMFLKTFYKEAGTEKSFGSNEQRLQAEAVYRYYFKLEPGEGWAGLRAGYTWHGFLVDDNPKIVESNRGGFVASLDLGVPVHKFVRLDAKASLIPYASPGDKEKARYGATASGGGFAFNGGIFSDFGHPEWHVGAGLSLDYLRFGDRYTNAEGVRPTFGRAVEDYLSFSLGLKGTL